MWLTVLWLTGCAVMPTLPGPPWADAGRPSVESSPHASQGPFNFGWRLSGHRAVAPLQVFDNGRRMWLHFPPNSPVPAILGIDGQGQHLLSYERHGDYLVLPSVWARLELKGGARRSVIERWPPPDHVDQLAVVSEPIQAAPTAARTSPVAEQRHVQATPTGHLVDHTPGPAASPPSAPPSPAGEASAPLAAPVDGSAVGMPAVSEQPARFTLDPEDGTLRAVLAKWAGIAQWQFGPEHWAVPIDIPLSGAAQFDPPFESAVEAALASTELTEHPLRPCFYSNQVLRVVPYVQACDRGGAIHSAQENAL